jgi:hypothetical protein
MAIRPPFVTFAHTPTAHNATDNGTATDAIAIAIAIGLIARAERRQLACP